MSPIGKRPELVNCSKLRVERGNGDQLFQQSKTGIHNEIVTFAVCVLYNSQLLMTRRLTQILYNLVGYKGGKRPRSIVLLTSVYCDRSTVVATISSSSCRTISRRRHQHYRTYHRNCTRSSRRRGHEGKTAQLVNISNILDLSLLLLLIKRIAAGRVECNALDRKCTTYVRKLISDHLRNITPIVGSHNQNQNEKAPLFYLQLTTT